MIRTTMMIAATLALAATPLMARPDKMPNRQGAGGGVAKARAGNGGGGGNYNRPNNNRPGNNGGRGGNYNGGSGHNTVVVNNGGGRHGGYYGGDYHHDHDVWDAVGTAAAVTATVGVTRAIIGSTVYQQPSGCVPINVGPTAYLQCGSTWYQPTYVGSQIQYVVVGPPRY